MRVRIWDGPIRLFHWALVMLLPLQWWTAEEDMMELHILLGMIVLGLLLFRLTWGVIGSSTARFTSFVRGPRAAIAYLRGRAAPAIGHNPLGALSVLAMLVVLAGHVTLGLFASDEDGLYSGPLAHLIDYDLSEEAAELHEKSFDLLLVLIGLHLAAIAYYALVRRKNLVGPMITGRGEAPEGAAALKTAPLWRLSIALAVAGGAVWWIGNGA